MSLPTAPLSWVRDGMVVNSFHVCGQDRLVPRKASRSDQKDDRLRDVAKICKIGQGQLFRISEVIESCHVKLEAPAVALRLESNHV